MDRIWIGEPVGDWDAAYDNSAAVAGSDALGARWAADAAAFRAALGDRAETATPYGDGPRQHYDLFRPQGEPRGLVVFVHGGYWKAQAIASWSHYAAGALARGYAVAVPEYTLCPAVRIADITREIGAFLEVIARRVAGPLHLTGHSAGGHLVARMACADAPLSPGVAARVGAVVSISGVHDLRPLISTAMNEVLQLDDAAARAESPALLTPRPGARLTCLAGGAELPEFRRQNALLANVWSGLGAVTEAFEAPGRHHFDVIDLLTDPDSRLVALLTPEA